MHRSEVVPIDRIPKDAEALDIGPKTREVYADVIKSSKLVIWNGPMGVFEFDAFAHGTNAVAQAMAEADATTIIGGGDSAAAWKRGFPTGSPIFRRGGGASLEFMEGKELPGVAALNDR